MAETTYPVGNMTAAEMRLIYNILKDRAQQLRVDALQASSKGNVDEARRVTAVASQVSTLALRFQR